LVFPFFPPYKQLPPAGVEHTSNSAENSQILKAGGADSGALGGDSGHFDPELQAVVEAAVDAWLTRATATPAGILEMVKAALSRKR